MAAGPLTQQTGPAAKEPPVMGLSSARFGGAVAAVAVASWLPALLGATTRVSIGWAAAAGLAVAVAWFTRHYVPTVLISAFLVSSALVPSGLVSDATHYMPVAVTGGALMLRLAGDARQYGLPGLPARPIIVAVGLYLAWAALSSVTSIDRRGSAVYLVGMVAVCALAFWLIPAALTRRAERERLLATLGVLGVAVALSVYIAWAVGGFTMFGRHFGLIEPVDLTIAGRATGIHFGFSTGLLLAPLEASVLMALAILALLGWSSVRPRRDFRLASLGIVLIVPAILITLDRSAWLTAAIGGGTFAALAYRAKIRASAGLVVGGFFALWFLLVLANLVGANTVAPACTANCTSSNQESTIRGGAGLSGREYLWQASLDAIRHRPLLGYGPGNNVQAIAPYLPSAAHQAGYNLEGYTSHSTWFRTAVEMGIPGLLFLLASGLATAWIFIRRALTAGAVPDATQVALAAAVVGLLPAMTFETFLLGGVTFSSLFLTVALGLAVGPVSQAITSGRRVSSARA